MIPKIIHYCWFGGSPLPESAQIYVDNWRRMLPDYEIRRWDESNFNISVCRYVKEAYEKRKFAFVSDYVRLYALKTYGGIYFDTDVEVVKSFDSLLDCDFFIGYESKDVLGTSVIGSVKDFRLLNNLLEYYDTMSFNEDTHASALIPNTELITRFLINEGVDLKAINENHDGIVIYEQLYFSPFNSLTNKFIKSDQTFSIHRFMNSWFPKYYIVEKKYWQALGLRNMKICLRLVNLIKHGTIKGRLFD